MKPKKGDKVVANIREGKSSKWILAKIEKVSGDSYLVLDEYSDNKDRYEVISKNVTQLSNTNTSYRIGERILAFWKNSHTSWTTELYEAEVVAKNKQTLTLKYQGSDDHQNVNITKTAKYPESYFEEEVEEDEDEEEEEKADVKDQNANAEKNNKNEKGGHKVNDNNYEEEENALQQKNPREKSKNHQDSHEEDSPREKDTFDRRFTFTFNQPPEESTPIIKLTDEEFSKFRRPTPPLERMMALEGTPLIDSLQDPDLFNQDFTHITSSGVIFAKEFQKKRYNSALMNGGECGRLGKIFKELKRMNLCD